MIDLHVPDGTTNEERDRLVLRAVLERGVVNLGVAPGDVRSHAFDLVQRGALVTHDRLGRFAEMTVAGHRLLAALDPSYTAPPGLYAADRWNDPDAMVARLAWLLSDRGKAEIRRGEPAPFISKKAADMIAAEARRRAGYDRDDERATEGV